MPDPKHGKPGRPKSRPSGSKARTYWFTDSEWIAVRALAKLIRDDSENLKTTSPEDDAEQAKLRRDSDALREWKREAMAVLAGWDTVFDLFRSERSDLGEHKYDIVREGIERLRAELIEAKMDAGNYRGHCGTCDTLNAAMLTDSYCAECEVNRLRAENIRLLRELAEVESRNVALTEIDRTAIYEHYKATKELQNGVQLILGNHVRIS
jgi:hypothetical protein